MQDFNKNKRIKTLRRMQGLPTLTDVIKDCLAGALLFAVILLAYLIIKVI